MNKFDPILVVTHVAFRKSPPYDTLEGPYSSVADSIISLTDEVFTCQLPLSDLNRPIAYGPWRNERNFRISTLLGKSVYLRYLTDFILVIFFAVRFCLTKKSQRSLIIGVDPLCTMPLTILKKVLGFKLIFYSVDFSKTRFKNKLLQHLYEKADELSTRFSDQVWVVCQSLKDYKKSHFGIESIYIPNSAIFDVGLYEKGKNQKTGNKMAWTGSFLTERQYDILFGLLRQFQSIRPDLEFYFAPMSNHDKFREWAQKYNLRTARVLELHSRREWQEFAANCDVGIAIYDEHFGSTEFIEPLKIWDFLMCGMPFIISCEPSISDPIKQSSVAYFLGRGNQIPPNDSLKDFLRKESIEKLRGRCIQLAQEFEIKSQIERAVARL